MGQFASQLGDRLTQLILVALVTTQTAGSALRLAQVLVITSLPALLLNPFAGVYVDRWDRKRTMVTCDLLRSMMVLSVPVIGILQTRVPLYIAVFILFALAAFFVPARLAMIPDVTPRGRLAEANALFTMTGMIGSTLTILLGALLVEWLGITKSCWINASSYMASAVFISSITRGSTVKKSSPAPAVQIVQEVHEGIRELWRHENTRQVISLLAILTAGSGATVVVGAVLIQQALGSVTRDLGFLSLWVGIGMLIGTFIYGRWGTRWPRRWILGIAFVGCGAAVWTFVGAAIDLKTRLAIAVATTVLGFWVAPVGIITNTLIHEAHPERLHGRIFSSLGIVVNVALIGSMLVAGWLAEIWGSGTFLRVIGASFVFGGVGVLCYTGKR